MKKFLLPIFLLLPFLSVGQIQLEGKVIDAVTKRPIPYVNLECFKLGIGTQSNQDGQFELKLAKASAQDTLKISCVGYQDKFIVKLQNAFGIIYELKPVSLVLKEVVITRKKPVEVQLGILKPTGRKFKPFNQQMQRPGRQSAVLMKNEGYGLAYIKSVHFFVGRDKYDAPFRIRLYDNVTGLPGKDLLEKSLELTAKKKNAWNEFDLSEYQIKLPEQGFYVAIEWLANEKYAAVNNLFHKEENVDGKIIKTPMPFLYYGPEIIQRIDSSYGITYRKFLSSGWYLHRAGTKPKDGGIVGFADLMVKATIEIVQ